MAARLPRFIGPYSVEGRLGTGGMGIVLYARHRLLGREVAVKIRHRGENQDEHLLAERFRQGAILQAESITRTSPGSTITSSRPCFRRS